MAYSGYKNWETWNVCLWFDNDRGLYDSVREYPGRFNAAKAKDFVLEIFPEGTPDMKELSRAELHTAYAKVSWSEVSKNFNEAKK